MFPRRVTEKLLIFFNSTFQNILGVVDTAHGRAGGAAYSEASCAAAGGCVATQSQCALNLRESELFPRCAQLSFCAGRPAREDRAGRLAGARAAAASCRELQRVRSERSWLRSFFDLDLTVNGRTVFRSRRINREISLSCKLFTVPLPKKIR